MLPPDQPIGKGAINWPAKTEPSRCIVVGGDPSWDPSWDTHIIYNNIKEGRTLKIPVPMPKRYHGRRKGPPAKACQFHACKNCRVQLVDYAKEMGKVVVLARVPKRATAQAYLPEPCPAPPDAPPPLQRGVGAPPPGTLPPAPPPSVAVCAGAGQHATTMAHLTQEQLPPPAQAALQRRSERTCRQAPARFREEQQAAPRPPRPPAPGTLQP